MNGNGDDWTETIAPRPATKKTSLDDRQILPRKTVHCQNGKCDSPPGCAGWVYLKGRSRKCLCRCHQFCLCDNPLMARYHCVKCGKKEKPKPMPGMPAGFYDGPCPF